MSHFSAEHCPELSPRSVPFSISNGPASTPEQSLDIFGSLALPGPGGGALAFTGGPTYALDWAPSGDFLALAAHRSAQTTHKLLQLYRGAAHVQIWRASAGGASLALHQLIPHAGDCIWDLKWRPGAEEPLLAAARGDGYVGLYLPSTDAPGPSAGGSAAASPGASGPAATAPELSVRAGIGAGDGSRAVAWSGDGRRLAVGTARGCIELHAAGVAGGLPAAHLLVRVRAHEGLVAGLRWMDAFALASVALDGTQRVRDVRDPARDLDRTSDGPGWHFAVAPAGAGVVAACSDGGHLRVTRVAALAGVPGPSDHKKTRVAPASLRALAAFPHAVGPARAPLSALFFAGAEGKVTAAAVPRPLWTKSGCQMRKSKLSTVLQWAPEKGSGAAAGGEGEEEGGAVDVNAGPLRLRLAASHREDAAAKQRPKSKRGYETVTGDVNLCAADYDQRVCIPRIALSVQGMMIAVATHAGLLTVLPLTEGMVFGTDDETLLNTKRSDAALPKPKKVKPVLVKRKRGRPRKIRPPDEQVQKDPGASLVETELNETEEGKKTTPVGGSKTGKKRRISAKKRNSERDNKRAKTGNA